MFFSVFYIHKLFSHFYTVYRIVDKFIPQGIDFVDNFLKFIAIDTFFLYYSCVFSFNMFPTCFFYPQFVYNMWTVLITCG